MRFGKKTVDNVNTDYWFLRDNGVNGRETIRILRIAYKEEKK